MRPSYWSLSNFSEKAAAKLLATSPGAPKFGTGKKPSNLIMEALGAGNTLTWPPEEIAWRPVPSGPVVGSKTMPARAGTTAPSVVDTVYGLAQGPGDVVPFAQLEA